MRANTEADMSSPGNSGVKDHYATLGVSKSATHDEIKKAYRKLARKCHPDLNPGSKECEAKSREINEAYDVIGDEKKRKEYDEARANPFGSENGFEYFRNGANARPFNSGFGGKKYTANYDFGGFGDVFSELFKFNARPDTQRDNRGDDLTAELTLTLDEAYTGVTKSLTIKRDALCINCAGNGVKGARACHVCNGMGTVAATDSMKVKIPPGVNTGSKVRLKGKGAMGAGAAGDVVIEIQVKPHPVFKRKDNDLYIDLPVTFVEAALGAKIEIPSLNGTSVMTLPEGTQSGRIFKLKGKGMPLPKGAGSGDLYVEVQVAVPARLTQKQREQIIALDDLYKEDVREHLKNLTREQSHG
ncbi:DnaJ C-terminal domain-containing protein [Candidatus Magnetominusculus xianensis]|uniref:Chaperone protein DnaJ n=1 Tax=Candidatus Magnetominusculus xianensis TaxID=1748249 RepID=A0ABR5SCN3_9BACT|nr:DnaJ C-terminal domain-containing protein [Candidatus Magnetominusculus xianensis]KWT78160.1 molecular chaperone DnaJ [Candidatus Magnetominusculus xianensis]MBF0404702.1 DnaJ domain-containing protein [Nitrospirota bacterium]